MPMGIVRIWLVATTDIHGNWLTEDVVGDRTRIGGMARVSSYVSELRRSVGAESVVVMDCGDFLQGGAEAYYHNFIDTSGGHMGAEVLNHMGYDVIAPGNHDVELGRDRLKRVLDGAQAEAVCANLEYGPSGEPWLKPYTIIERRGVRIAVTGFLTQDVSDVDGLSVTDVEEATRKWTKIIGEQERVDVIVGLFHAGTSAEGAPIGNEALSAAINVDGPTVMMAGHDHREFCNKIINGAGREVTVINAGANGTTVAVAEIEARMDDDGNVAIRNITGRLVDLRDMTPDLELEERLAEKGAKVKAWANEEIGIAVEKLGVTGEKSGKHITLMELIHEAQSAATGAEISIATAPSAESTIAKGTIRMKDLLRVFRYDDRVATLKMSGKEISDYLNGSYEEQAHGEKRGSAPLPESAAGIEYEVIAEKDGRMMVEITGMSDGKAFEPEKHYSVAMNAYVAEQRTDNRLCKWVGIGHEEIKNRVIDMTANDLRSYVRDTIERRDVLGDAEMMLDY